ncbi:MAG: hypothetical protein BRD57_05310 [Proteobacteria bacterium SW_6_67_9]|nr:MAG: hypothetical protein BRD57_05310 [Proteobacteria bacterium SW_6_67_9]
MRPARCRSRAPTSISHRPRHVPSRARRRARPWSGAGASWPYSPGREVTVRGIVTGTEEGRIDAVTYTYPTVDIEAIKLWEPRAQVRREEPRFHFGFGIIRRY